MNTSGSKSVPVTAHVHQGKTFGSIFFVLLARYIPAKTYAHTPSGTHTLMHRQHCNLIKHATVESLLVLV